MNTFSAVAKNLKVSPRKMRLVVDGVKNMPINSALAVLGTTSKRAGVPIKKALESAIANAVNNGNVNKDDLFIKEMFVNEGISYKRYHFAARGRIRPYKKRTSHLKVVLGVKDKNNDVSLANQKKEELVAGATTKESDAKKQKQRKEEANK